MQKGKRILAIIGIIFLLSLYLITFISSIMVTPYSSNLFEASIYCTMIIPIMIYAYALIYRVLKKRNQKPEE